MPDDKIRERNAGIRCRCSRWSGIPGTRAGRRVRRAKRSGLVNGVRREEEDGRGDPRSLDLSILFSVSFVCSTVAIFFPSPQPPLGGSGVPEAGSGVPGSAGGSWGSGVGGGAGSGAWGAFGSISPGSDSRACQSCLSWPNVRRGTLPASASFESGGGGVAGLLGLAGGRGAWVRSIRPGPPPCCGLGPPRPGPPPCLGPPPPPPGPLPPGGRSGRWPAGRSEPRDGSAGGGRCAHG